MVDIEAMYSYAVIVEGRGGGNFNLIYADWLKTKTKSLL